MAVATKPFPISFPKTSRPGQRPSENRGSLVNAIFEDNGGESTWRRAPGLTAFADTLKSSPRGFLDVGGLLYGAYEAAAVTISPVGVVTPIASLSGTGPVTWARNNAATPQIVCVTDTGCFSVTSGAVTTFADADLPAPNSVASLNGYFLWTIGDGRIFASDLNAITVNALSFTTAQAKGDGLTRGVAYGSQFFAFGPASCEVYQDAGTSPFPLARVTVIPVGIIGPWAVAGGDDGWDGPLIFVAADGTVKLLEGYVPRTISTPDVNREIQAVGDKRTLKASVFTADGHSFWVLESPSWTWLYDVSNGTWSKRASVSNGIRWRAAHCVYFQNQWLAGDRDGTNLLAISGAVYKELGDALAASIVGVRPSFPRRFAIGFSWFDVTTGQGNPAGSENEANPQVIVQWSKDGGATWSPSSLQYALGQEGQFSQKITAGPIGLTRHHGIQFKLTFADPVYFVLRGGEFEAEVRR